MTFNKMEQLCYVSLFVFFQIFKLLIICLIHQDIKNDGSTRQF